MKDKNAVPIIIVYGRHSPMRRQVFPCISDLRVHMVREDRSDTARHSKPRLILTQKKKKAAAVTKTKSSYKRNVSWILCTACSSTLLPHALSVRLTRGIWLVAIKKYELVGTAESAVREDLIAASVYTCEAAQANKFISWDSAPYLPESSNQSTTNFDQPTNRA